MTPKERAAMQQALEALKDYHKYDEDKISVAMSILQNALAEQAEQEPVAWVWLDDWLNDGYPEDCFSRVNHKNKTPLYAAPVRTKDLTDDEIFAFDNKAEIEPLAFARAVIAADREKNHG